MTQWKLVPVEPTNEMFDCWIEWGGKQMNYHEAIGRFNVGWKRILNAAPAPDVQPVAWMYTANGERYLTFTDQRPVEAYHTHFEKSTPLYTHPPAAEVQELERSERYQIQMAAISTASLGYWKEGDAISPEYDTVALRDVAKLYGRYEAARADVAELVEVLKEIIEHCPNSWAEIRADVALKKWSDRNEH